MILLTGATGNIGGQLAKLVAARGGQVRALVRDGENAAPLRALNIEVVIGDLAQPASLDAALRGADTAFLLSALEPRAAELQGNFVEAARRAGIRHLVKSSALGAASDAPAAGLRWHAETEQQIRDSGIPFTFVRPNSFMQSLLSAAPTIKSQGAFYLPQGDAKVSWTDVRDIAAVEAATLTEPGHEGKVYEVTGPEALSCTEVAAKLSAAIGKTVRYVDVPPEAYTQTLVGFGVPPAMATLFTELQQYFATGRAAYVTDTVEAVTKQPARTFDQFAREFAGAFSGS